MAIASYGSDTTSSGVVRIMKDVDTDLVGRHVLVVEDIVDSGVTLSYLQRYLWAHRPATLEVCALLGEVRAPAAATSTCVTSGSPSRPTSSSATASTSTSATGTSPTSASTSPTAMPVTDVRSGPRSGATGAGRARRDARSSTIPWPSTACRDCATPPPTAPPSASWWPNCRPSWPTRPSATSATVDRRVDTPVASGVWCRRVDEMVLLVPVLRAGLGMVPAIQGALPATEVAHVGLRRNEATLRGRGLPEPPAQGPGRAPRRGLRPHAGHRWIAGPGLRHGEGSVRRRAVTVLCLIASVPGLAYFRTRHPDVDVACVAVDPALDDRGFIVPGLGRRRRPPVRAARLIGGPAGLVLSGRCPRPTDRVALR